MSGRNSQPRHGGRQKAGMMDKWLNTFGPLPNLWNPEKVKRIPKPKQEWPETPTRQATADEIREAARRGA